MSCLSDSTFLFLGTYSISYMPHVLGTHYLNISIFDRAIRGSPFELEVGTTIAVGNFEYC